MSPVTIWRGRWLAQGRSWKRAVCSSRRRRRSRRTRKASSRRADLALLVNRPDLARTFLSEAAARWPRDAAVRLRYGLALIVAGQTPAAIGQLEEAVRLDPGVAAAHLNLAVLYAQTGRTAEAAAEAREALRLQPDYPQAEGLLRALQGSHGETRVRATGYGLQPTGLARRQAPRAGRT